jgi:hypothetical protein
VKKIKKMGSEHRKHFKVESLKFNVQSSMLFVKQGGQSYHSGALKFTQNGVRAYKSSMFYVQG